MVTPRLLMVKAQPLRSVAMNPCPFSGAQDSSKAARDMCDGAAVPTKTRTGTVKPMKV